jgi:hypothetical protein
MLKWERIPRTLANAEWEVPLMNIQPLLSPYDFTACMQVPPHERIRCCIDEIHRFHTDRDDVTYEGIPAIPSMGATEAELH